MSSRDLILSAIQKNKPAEKPLPVYNFADNPVDVVETFINVLTAIGSACSKVKYFDAVTSFLQANTQEGKRMIQAIPSLPDCNGQTYATTGAAALADVHTIAIMGSLAVAENGCIWLSESDMMNRLFPFICERLVLVINASAIVPTMHEAYATIKTNKDGYGVFIAGPSKTADIEQSLVIGAHGPLSLQVFIVAD